MKNVEWIQKTYNADKNTEKMCIKEDWLYF